MAKNNIPLGIKITGWWVRMISFVLFGLAVFGSFKFVTETIRKPCRPDNIPCALTGIPGQGCGIRCSHYSEAIISDLILILILFATAAMIFWISKKLLQAKKIGWYGSLAVLVLANVPAAIFYVNSFRNIARNPDFIDLLPLINFIPLFLLLAGRKEFLKRQS